MINIDNRTERRRLGDLGEGIACTFLEKHGFTIVERNYVRKWGEIDIVAKKGDLVRFVEVKTVSHVTSQEAGYRPEDNVHLWKLKRLSRTIETYLLQRKLDCDWQLDLITVIMDMDTHKAHVELIENIII
jgi:putative endonuclease